MLWKVILLSSSLHLLSVIPCSTGQTYPEAKSIYKELLDPDRYDPDVRPILNQSRVLDVYVAFEIISIVEVDDVAQSFSCNGFVWFSWKDELLMWNPADYGGAYIIHPDASRIWKPRIGLMNTLTDRDPFKDDHHRVRMYYDGGANWIPGSLFPVSCQLDLTNYPFDHQTCYIYMASLMYDSKELQFHPMVGEVGKMFYTVNGEWELVASSIDALNNDIGYELLPVVQFSFALKRRPTFAILNIVMPIVLLSFLNIFVFIIPVESGEKVSYGITVLLALALFMSIISSMLPRSAETMPTVLIYLFIIFIVSILTVLDSIVIVFIHHKEVTEDINWKKKEKIRRAAANVVTPADLQKTASGKLKTINVASITSVKTTTPSSKVGQLEQAWAQEGPSPRNKYRAIGKYVDLVSFSIFLLVWLTLSLGFLLHVSATVDLHKLMDKVKG